MDKQIEEMAKDISHANFYATEECLATDCEDCKYKHHLNGSCKDRFRAEYLLNAGYRKIPEGAVVLTREEYDKLQALKGDYVKGYEAGVDEGWDIASHVTAEKFAERLKKLVAYRNCNEDYEWEDLQVDGQIFIECVDEICKEIIGGTDDDTSQVGK